MTPAQCYIAYAALLATHALRDSGAVLRLPCPSCGCVIYLPVPQDAPTGWRCCVCMPPMGWIHTEVVRSIER
jgi:hypothetical protein